MSAKVRFTASKVRLLAELMIVLGVCLWLLFKVGISIWIVLLICLIGMAFYLHDAVYSIEIGKDSLFINYFNRKNEFSISDIAYATKAGWDSKAALILILKNGKGKVTIYDKATWGGKLADEVVSLINEQISGSKRVESLD